MNKTIIENIKLQLLPSNELIDATKAAIKANQTKKGKLSKVYVYSAVTACSILLITLFTVFYFLKNPFYKKDLTLDGNNLTKFENEGQIPEMDINEDSGKHSRIYIATDYPVYDKDSILNESDIIVIGKVEKIKGTMKLFPKILLDESLSQEEKEIALSEVQQNPMIYTVSEIKVDKVLKGNLQEGEVIEVKQLGGKLNGREVIFEDEEIFEEGSTRVFFLKDYRDEIGEDMPFSTVNPIQGDIEIVNGKLKNKEEIEGNKEIQIAEEGISVKEFIDYVKSKVE